MHGGARKSLRLQGMELELLPISGMRVIASRVSLRNTSIPLSPMQGPSRSILLATVPLVPTVRREKGGEDSPRHRRAMCPQMCPRAIHRNLYTQVTKTVRLHSPPSASANSPYQVAPIRTRFVLPFAFLLSSPKVICFCLCPCLCLCLCLSCCHPRRGSAFVVALTHSSKLETRN
jgi:hypothetical protein